MYVFDKRKFPKVMSEKQVSFVNVAPELLGLKILCIPIIGY
jgi:hypothetical protein